MLEVQSYESATFRHRLPPQARTPSPALAQNLQGPTQGRAAFEEARAIGRVRRLPQLRDRRRPALSRLEPLRSAGAALLENVRRRGRTAGHDLPRHEREHVVR